MKRKHNGSRWLTYDDQIDGMADQNPMRHPFRSIDSGGGLPDLIFTLFWLTLPSPS